MNDTNSHVLNEIEQKVLDIIKGNLEGGPYDDDEILTNDYTKSGMLDSLSFVSLVIDLEVEFNISIEDNNLDLEKLSGFELIVNMITQLKE